MKILLVDDDPDVRKIAGLSLSRMGGLDVEEADGGPAALRAARNARPDVVVIDVMMPGMDGPTTVRFLKENADTRDIPVVFLTAKAQPQEVERLLALGAVGVLSKPFDPIELPRLLLEILDRAER